VHYTDEDRQEQVSIDRPFPILNSSHIQGHKGNGYIAGYYDAAIVNNGTMDIFILMSADRSAHAIWDIAVSADFTFQLFESIVVSGNGTGLSELNRARYSSNTSNHQIFHTPAGVNVSAATAFPIKFIPGGSGGIATGGQDGGFDREVILKKGLNYLFRLTNISGQTNKASLTLEWYEPR
jgi:hypothetical protein